MRSSFAPRLSKPPSKAPPGGERTPSRYAVVEELAAGGMGVVYRVQDRQTGEARALKRILPDATRQPFMVEAFEREYQVLAGLDHPRIIRVFDYGVDEQGPFYTMELLEGEDMRKAAPLPYRTACLYLRDVATSLALLHARRLIHRDLSPANVRMTPDGHCKLLDFGALTAFGTSRVVVGTPPAVPPEAVEGAPLDQRADLYALGALAYWMFTGQHAFPARRIEELPELWKQAPPPPSDTVPDVPDELDHLVASLLSLDPLARPASAAEVIARLTVIGELSPEDEGDAERLAQSFLLSPRFTGRTLELAELEARTRDAARGKGAAVLVSAVAGMGRTRLLEEAGVRALIAGAAVLRVDASMYRQPRGTVRALSTRLFDALPDAARDAARQHRVALTLLGREVEGRLPAGASARPSYTDLTPDPGGSLERWFIEVSRTKPLVIEVDNVEYADTASLGLLAALARASTECPMLLIVTERVRRESEASIGLSALRAHCHRMELHGLSANETLDLVHSLFGDAPNVALFSEWLHGRTAGSPLHSVETSRQLVARRVIRYFGGMWVLPADRPDAELPPALEDALSMRIASLSEDAQSLAECLSLQREQPTLELCRQLFDSPDARKVLGLLDELARNDVLYADQDGYRFSSTALRESLFGGMDDARREQNHRRLGEAFFRLAEDDPAVQIEAGFHLMKGGDETRGADLVAFVARDSVTVRQLIANLHLVGRPVEEALKIYKRHRRSVHERTPLLTALAQAGYYEDRAWGERYGDEALDAIEDLSGLRLANRLRPYLGRALGLVIGLIVAVVRFHLVPRRERNYSFAELLVQLFGVVTTLTGATSTCFDVDRAARVAAVLEPFSFLPNRLTPVGIHQFCRALEQIGREHQAAASKTFEELLRRFQDPKYYPTLPDEARLLYITGVHFSRGAFAVFRTDGRSALESADALDASGLKLYEMIASQLRFLYHANRGELALAAPHRELVDLHAAHVGSAWQVETWEPAALIPLYTNLNDVVALTRIVDRLELQCRTVPSLKLHAQLARLALHVCRGDATERSAELTAAIVSARPPRSFIGWAACHGQLARGLSSIGRHAEAKAVCERALAHITDDDREYVGLFLTVDLQMAVAEAGLGDGERALARLDALLERYRESEHPLALGLLHEARARIAWNLGKKDEYKVSLAEVARWFRPTATPALVAKYERLADLSGAPAASRRMAGAPASTSARTLPRTGTSRTERTGSEAMTVRVGPLRHDDE